MSHRKQKMLQGFSLGEVILSIAVLTAGLLPILGALNGALTTSFDSRDTIVAAGLAQEGVELVVNVRDNASLRDPNDAFIDFPADANIQTCYIDPEKTPNIIADAISGIPCGGAPNNYLLQDNPSFTYYMHSNGPFTNTIFYRKIFIYHGVGSVDAVVLSAVYWNPGIYTPSTAGGFPSVRANCTVSNGCTYSETELTAWR